MTQFNDDDSRELSLFIESLEAQTSLDVAGRDELILNAKRNWIVERSRVKRLALCGVNQPRFSPKPAAVMNSSTMFRSFSGDGNSSWRHDKGGGPKFDAAINSVIRFRSLDSGSDFGC